MKHRLLILMSAILFSATIWAQTPDGETPANEGMCDDLMYFTPGLYGLCVAFCEAQDCDPDLSSELPYANCKTSSTKILDIYNKKKRAGDPDMPCIEPESTECPCFTPEDVATFAWPVRPDAPGDYCEQSVEFDVPPGPGIASMISTGWDGTKDYQIFFSNRQYIHSDERWYYRCGMRYDNYVDPKIIIYHEPSAELEEVCRSIIDDYIGNMGGCPSGTGYPY